MKKKPLGMNSYGMTREKLNLLVMKALRKYVEKGLADVLVF